ncbi:unnamed protein product [Prunus armeniaca]|uniref:Uncharacterized protein n=1 Tax=Prunus armeniaca TaxID=36596 RepID=A0A6J5TEM2_PRUAR|nr:unnamed protein product [Prunus armeniaca]CAB4292179.1 unnamed protein product [Prunus armeniaca]
MLAREAVPNEPEINPKSYLKNNNLKFVGIRGGSIEIEAKGDHQLRGYSNSNFKKRFDVGELRIANIQAKISVEDFDYLKGFANSNKRIDENDLRLVKIRAKILEEDVDYLKGLANKRFGVVDLLRSKEVQHLPLPEKPL